MSVKDSKHMWSWWREVLYISLQKLVSSVHYVDHIHVQLCILNSFVITKGLLQCRQVCIICRKLCTVLKVSFVFIPTHACSSLTIKVWLASQMYDGIKYQLHCWFTCLYTLWNSKCLLYISTDLGKAILKLLITFMLFVATGIITPVMLIAAFCHRGNAYVKLKSKFVVLAIS